MGVHTNMCVLGRPFGLRQLVRNKKNVVLMRDMTDSMYNPKQWPYVDHFTGHDLVISHVERFVCPTITSDQILGGKPFQFKNDSRKIKDVQTLTDLKKSMLILCASIGTQLRFLLLRMFKPYCNKIRFNGTDLVFVSLRNGYLKKVLTFICKIPHLLQRHG